MTTQGFLRLTYLQLWHFLVGVSYLLQLHISFFVLPFGSMIQCCGLIAPRPSFREIDNPGQIPYPILSP